MGTIHIYGSKLQVSQILRMDHFVGSMARGTTAYTTSTFPTCLQIANALSYLQHTNLENAEGVFFFFLLNTKALLHTPNTEIHDILSYRFHNQY